MPLFVVKVPGDDLEKTTSVARKLAAQGAKPVGDPYSVSGKDALFFNVEARGDKDAVQNIAGSDATVSD